MSTVLWANELGGGVVTSDAADKYALYKHAGKLDGIAQRACRRSFQAMCDTTDLKFNQGSDELPAGMTSTDELMARDGKWVDAADAVDLLAALLKDIEAKKTRFGLLRNDHADVVDELKESLAFAQGAKSKAAKFNFSVVM